MNIHEYQAKELFREFDIAVPNGVVVGSTAQVKKAWQTLGGHTWVVKGQIHAGGRGKSGGVIICKNVDEVVKGTKKLLGTKLITKQTDQCGLLVNQVLIEQAQTITQTLYLSLLVERQSRQIAIIATTKGGVNIEQIIQDNPSLVAKILINPCLGLVGYQAQRLGFDLGLGGDIFKQFVALLANAYRLFMQKDLELLEINPLIINADQQLLALDAKVIVANNALYRQTGLLALKDDSQSNYYERLAAENHLSYVALTGNIGCMVNGAGLAMATMDLIKYYGGSPANFLDVGGSTTKERVVSALEIILGGQNVRVILINIFGGIVHCDLIAQGILQAAQNVEIAVPIVVRLAGTNAQEGLEILTQANINIYSEMDLTKATQKAVDLARGTTL